jgi:hypothetical protein
MVVLLSSHYDVKKLRRVGLPTLRALPGDLAGVPVAQSLGDDRVVRAEDGRCRPFLSVFVVPAVGQ